MEVSCGWRYTKSGYEFIVTVCRQSRSDSLALQGRLLHVRLGSNLVTTGVYDPCQGPPSHRPTHEVEDVEQAVQWAFERRKA